MDYQQLLRDGADPENLWWFFNFCPLVYDKDRLIADNYADYLFSLRDLRNVAIAWSFTAHFGSVRHENSRRHVLDGLQRRAANPRRRSYS